MKKLMEKYPENFTGEILRGAAVIQTPEQIQASKKAMAELETLAAPLVEWVRNNHGSHTEICITSDRVTVKHDGMGLPFPYPSK